MSERVRKFFSLKNIFRFSPKDCNNKPKKKSFKEWAYNASCFRKYGLMRDDLLNEEFNADVAEAMRRLPDKLYYERCYRIIRAMQLSLMYQTLPEKEWTTLETDIQYLKPYVEEVRQERQEREEWDKNN